jgi:drug/metabolite transporter (DMT)-like permease
MRKTTLAGLALTGAALLFGSTFVVVKSSVESFPPLNFVAWRFLVGGLALSVLALPRGLRLWRDAFAAGAFLFLGYALQTVGLTMTSASNSALITGLYVVITPLLAAALARRAPDPWVSIGVMVAFVGTALLTVSDGFQPEAGDLLTLGCAFAFSAHILSLARFAPRHPVVPFTAAQVLVTSVLAFAAAFWLEGIEVPPAEVLPGLLGTALAVSAGAYLLQIWAQTVVGASRTAVILGLEPAFGVATAALVLGERLSTAAWAGAGLIVGAIYVVIARTGETDLVRAEAVSDAH